jgi:RND family efflux transporter MFP subunit
MLLPARSLPWLTVLFLACLAGFAQAQTKAKTVQTAQPIWQEWPQEASVLGRIEAIGHFTYQSPDYCQVQHIHVALGESVMANQPLMSLDCPAIAARQKATQEAVARAQTQLDRLMALANSQSVDQSQIDTQRLVLAQSQAELAQAQRQSAQQFLSASVSGQVTHLEVRVGQQLNAQDSLMTLQPLDSRRLVAHLDAHRPVSQGDLLILEDKDPSKGRLQLTISHLITPLDALQNQRIEADLPSLAPFRAGSWVKVTWLGPAQTLLTLPEIAVVLSGSQHFVWVIREGKAQKIPLKVIERKKGWVAVEAPTLSQDDSVVTEGAWLIKPNQALQTSSMNPLKK